MKNLFKNNFIWLAIVISFYGVSIFLLQVNLQKMKNNFESNNSTLQKLNASIKLEMEQIIYKQNQLKSLEQEKNSLEIDVKKLN